MNDISVLDNVKIEDMIYEIRGKQVMFDRDLAILYGCVNGAKTINQAVKRHIDRFPEDFYFQITETELNSSRSQTGTLNKNDNYRGSNVKYLPYVFTEEGVAMLSTVLRTSTASSVSINIMRAFVLMRKYIANNNYNLRISNIETKLIEHDNKLVEVFDKLSSKPNNHIFFEGQIYDAYSLLIDILNKAKNEIIIVDNYIDKNLLDILSKIDKKIEVITSKINEKDVEKYNNQYSNININIDKRFHDRFIILDKNILYHSGASFKDLGKKCFAISRIESKEILDNLLKNIN